MCRNCKPNRHGGSKKSELSARCMARALDKEGNIVDEGGGHATTYHNDEEDDGSKQMVHRKGLAGPPMPMPRRSSRGVPICPAMMARIERRMTRKQKMFRTQLGNLQCLSI